MLSNYIHGNICVYGLTWFIFIDHSIHCYSIQLFKTKEKKVVQFFVYRLYISLKHKAERYYIYIEQRALSIDLL